VNEACASSSPACYFYLQISGTQPAHHIARLLDLNAVGRRGQLEARLIQPLSLPPRGSSPMLAQLCTHLLTMQHVCRDTNAPAIVRNLGALSFLLCFRRKEGHPLTRAAALSST
jgi:hypothetical protein